ncbi:hypothetical protein TVAG_174530 [Trichomonas vaginalis G3]|uniref:Mannosyltransferase n=1 Tax=Trichomonas vaginalis (strain ATCC PRA-98 / G3) TaxID=412133 RepID=A2EK00_TRIV3|nr:hypothetical protein TVAGG3_0974550 [Trichomonas vaginalis G3]EAY06984.1 hypothetical protein TVAG_174530 [Trichomonas vaginalis G3]KAI5488836.1 hypothetical protein TVAGG3_0974550 [Trichomonas vaginalis G3]|eukprot:XP_001319207.1 hypothetical protein [Trichomonas vaginalis G3]
MYLSMFENNAYSKGSGYSDLGFHLNIITSIAHGFNHKRHDFMTVESPIFSGVQLVYPIIPNFYSAFLISTGHCSIRYSLLIPSTLVGWSFIISLYSLSLYFTRSHFAATLSVIIYFNLGGLGFMVLKDEKCRKYGYWDLVFNWCNNNPQYWFHPLTHIIIPQRASLFVFPLIYWAYLSILLAILKKNHKLMALAGLLTALMPQVQLHAYLSIAEWSILFCLLKLIEGEWKNFKSYFIIWSVYGITAIPLAIPQILPYLKRVGELQGQFMQYNPIWLSKDFKIGDSFFKPIILWINSLGAFIVISLVIGLFYLNRYQISVYLPNIIIFIIANLILYQPWAADNTKIFYTGWIPFAVPVVANFMSKLVNLKFSIPKFISCFVLFCILLILLTISGLLTTITTMQYPTCIYHKEAGSFDFGLWVAENTPVKAIFSMEGGPGNPIPAIAGRQMYCGYGGWIYTHGLPMDRYWEIVSTGRDPSNFSFYDNNGIMYAGNIASTQYSFDTPLYGWSKVFDAESNVLYRRSQI